MRRKTYEETNRPLGTWLSPAELEHFRAIAQAHNVSPAAYLRAIVVDVLAEERERVPVPRRRFRSDVFSIMHGEALAGDLSK